MDALEFAREKKRMCESVDACGDCPAKKIARCGEIKNIEILLPMVEKWSKEHPLVRNVDHVAEGLEKLGYKVEKEELALFCPPHESTLYCEPGGCDHNDHECDECRKWWLEEYTGEDINVLGKGAKKNDI